MVKKAIITDLVERRQLIFRDCDREIVEQKIIVSKRVILCVNAKKVTAIETPAEHTLDASRRTDSRNPIAILYVVK
jgi:hypothetical protein